jgi:hypothetical protein
VNPEADPVEDLEPVADLWATVDLERALDERGHAPGAAEAAVADPLLGARVAVIAGDDGGLLAIAEPTTEGRLAASLARAGEGLAGSYRALGRGDTLQAYRRRAHAAGVPISRIHVGPFGPSVLVIGGSVAGPHLIVVERRSLPSRP